MYTSGVITIIGKIIDVRVVSSELSIIIIFIVLQLYF